MKKIIPAYVIIATLISCSNNKSQEETVKILDSIKESVNAEERAAQLANEARIDSLCQDSIVKMEKFIAAIPSFAQISNHNHNYDKLFKSLGYTISYFTSKGWDNEECVMVPVKCVIANYTLDEDHYVLFREEPDGLGFKITIKGAPDELAKFAKAAKADLKKLREENPHDWYFEECKVTVSENSVTYTWPMSD